MPVHPDALTAARSALASLQTFAAEAGADYISPRAERELREAMPRLADIARTAALVSIAESLHTLATEDPR